VARFSEAASRKAAESKASMAIHPRALRKGEKMKVVVVIFLAFLILKTLNDRKKSQKNEE
jgi:hypothetical protein